MLTVVDFLAKKSVLSRLHLYKNVIKAKLIAIPTLSIDRIQIMLNLTKQELQMIG